jgi:hypothetical protein
MMAFTVCMSKAYMEWYLIASNAISFFALRLKNRLHHVSAFSRQTL